MSTTDKSSGSNPQGRSRGPNALEITIERLIFLSRWLMAPVYLGLAGALLVLLWVFFVELFHLLESLQVVDPTNIILVILSLIDLSLVGNLLLIVIFSGYENFVSRLDVTEEEDRPDWHGKIDFSAIKLRLRTHNDHRNAMVMAAMMTAAKKLFGQRS